MVNWVWDTDAGMVPDFEMEQRIRGVGGGDASVDFANTLRNGLQFTAGAAGPGGAVGAPGPSAPGPGGQGGPSGPPSRYGPSPNAGPNELKFWASRYQQATSPNSAQAAMQRLLMQEQLLRQRLEMERGWKKEDTQSDRAYAEQQRQNRIQMLKQIYGIGGAPGTPSTEGTRAPGPASPQPAAPPTPPPAAGPTGPTPGFTSAPSGGALDSIRPDGVGAPPPTAQPPVSAPPRPPQAQAVPQPNAVDQEMRQIDGQIDGLRRQLQGGVFLEDKSMIDAAKSELSRLERRRNELMDQRKSQSAYEKTAQQKRAAYDQTVVLRGKAFEGLMGHINALRNMPKEFKAMEYNFDAAIGPMHSAPFGSEIVGTGISAVTPGYNEMRDAIKQRTAMIVDEIKSLRGEGEGTLSDQDMIGFEKQAGDLLNAGDEAEFQRRLDRLVEGMASKFRAKGVDVKVQRDPAGAAPPQPNVGAAQTLKSNLNKFDEAAAKADPQARAQMAEAFKARTGMTPDEARARFSAPPPPKPPGGTGEGLFSPASPEEMSTSPRRRGL